MSATLKYRIDSSGFTFSFCDNIKRVPLQLKKLMVPKVYKCGSSSTSSNQLRDCSQLPTVREIWPIAPKVEVVIAEVSSDCVRGDWRDLIKVRCSVRLSGRFSLPRMLRK